MWLPQKPVMWYADHSSMVSMALNMVNKCTIKFYVYKTTIHYPYLCLTPYPVNLGIFIPILFKFYFPHLVKLFKYVGMYYSRFAINKSARLVNVLRPRNLEDLTENK